MVCSFLLAFLRVGGALSIFVSSSFLRGGGGGEDGPGVLKFVSIPPGTLKLLTY